MIFAPNDIEIFVGTHNLYQQILHGILFLDLGGQTRVFFCHLRVSDLKPQQSWDICIPVLAPSKLAWAIQGRAILSSQCCSSSSGSVPGSIWGKGSCYKRRAQTRQPQSCGHNSAGISWTGSHLLSISNHQVNLIKLLDFRYLMDCAFTDLCKLHPWHTLLWSSVGK